MRPTQVTQNIKNQFNALAPRAPFFINGVEYIRSARVSFNTEDMITFSFDGYDQSAGLSCTQTHSIEFSVIFCDRSDTYTWSFSVIDERDGSAKHGEFSGMFWDQFSQVAELIDYAINK